MIATAVELQGYDDSITPQEKGRPSLACLKVVTRMDWFAPRPTAQPTLSTWWVLW